MTQVQVSESSVVTTFIWPDYETAMAAWDEYGGKVTEAIRNSGAKVDVQEGLVERAWFNQTADMAVLTNFYSTAPEQTFRPVTAALAYL